MVVSTSTGCTLLLAGHALAAGAGSEPAELDADTVEYDMTTGVIQATDNVLMKQGDTHIAGQRRCLPSFRRKPESRQRVPRNMDPGLRRDDGDGRIELEME